MTKHAHDQSKRKVAGSGKQGARKTSRPTKTSGPLANLGHTDKEPSGTLLRAGWAQASRAIATSGDDALSWPEFASKGDQNLKW